ncbi:transcriptional regulator [Anaerocolumna cellulosilytica]|uniref:Transcriptional regulator n=1 Tax=Anaerocolumna cellulosilytica TaxID=433286 RepID=A0A6S6QXH0_9FIRM|nr:helix-turn-helix transcriptional regulator [Anaerocolumna cellulosilytica]MBB5196452.1 transcriptional regulator with XRE-family HTH domain [Anaerocolumna cellulosilytica]BCJ94426.1 transcriptional regulator [Anaerocolumna cellulosilytica]
MYERVRNLRTDRDLTQKQISEYLNCSQRVYSDYECGKVSIPVHVLIKLADFYQTSVDYLLDRTNQKKPYPN